MSEMTPQEEQEQDDKLLDRQIDAHLEHELILRRLDEAISVHLRQSIPCPEGPCADCGGTGINPEYLNEGMNGQYLVYVSRVQRPKPTERIDGVPI